MRIRGGGGRGCRRVSLLLSLMCSLRFLGLSAIIRCIGLDWLITVGMVCVLRSWLQLILPALDDIHIHHVLRLIS